MPSGTFGLSTLASTYPPKAFRLAHPGSPAFTSALPTRVLRHRRMAPKAQAAPPAVQAEGAKFPSTAGQGSQRTLTPHVFRILWVGLYALHCIV